MTREERQDNPGGACQYDLEELSQEKACSRSCQDLGGLEGIEPGMNAQKDVESTWEEACQEAQEGLKR